MGRAGSEDRGHGPVDRWVSRHAGVHGRTARSEAAPGLAEKQTALAAKRLDVMALHERAEQAVKTALVELIEIDAQLALVEELQAEEPVGE